MNVYSTSSFFLNQRPFADEQLIGAAQLLLQAYYERCTATSRYDRISFIATSKIARYAIRVPRANPLSSKFRSRGYNRKQLLRM